MLTFNGQPVNQLPWAKMKPGDVVFVPNSYGKSRNALRNEAMRFGRHKQVWTSCRDGGTYLWVPSDECLYPLEPRKHFPPPVTPVEQRRAERRQWWADAFKDMKVVMPAPRKKQRILSNKYPQFESLQVGASFYVDDLMKRSSVTRHAWLYGQKLDRRFKVDVEGDGLRVTRLPDYADGIAEAPRQPAAAPYDPFA